VRYYRFNHDHWNFDQAYAEMKQFDFYTSNGHGKQLDFVQDTGSNSSETNQGKCFRNCCSLRQI